MIQNLATQFGIPLAQAGQAEQPQHKSQTDFTPPIDIIDTPTGYTIHVSLPGAKKEDLSIEYDEAESVLRIAGVVYRPGLDEEMHKGLVVQERSGEVGVFERDVVLGTRASPAGVVVDAIGARLEDGVLRVTVPKVGEREKKAGKKVVVEDEMENEKMDESDGKEFVRVDVQ